MDKDKQKQLAKAFLKNKIKSFLRITAIAVAVIFATMLLISPKVAAYILILAILLLTMLFIFYIIEFIIGLVAGFEDSNKGIAKKEYDIDKADSTSNHKYAKYIDENDEIPIFVMEKKYLITDWGNKLAVAIFGPIVFIISIGENDHPLFIDILGIIFSIGCLYYIIISFLHDIFVRKIICYDKYLKVTNRFKEHKVEYSQIPMIYSQRLGLSIFGYKALTIGIRGNYFARHLNTEQFGMRNIWHFEKLLKHKGIKEWSLFGYKD